MTATISVALIFSIAALATQLYTLWNGGRQAHRDKTKETVDIQTNFIELKLKLDNIQSSTDRIMDKQEQHAIKMEQVSGEIIRVNERIQTLFKYKDDHETRLKVLEEKK